MVVISCEQINNFGALSELFRQTGVPRFETTVQRGVGGFAKVSADCFVVF
jgi:hypothetical protein